MIIDHLGFPVSDLARSRAFYAAALAPLGIELIMQVQGWAGFGRNGKAEFWIGEGDLARSPMHVAFAASDRAQVRAFHAAATAAGAEDNGAPGIRTIYHTDYYAAFVICPDGHNIEAVCHRPEPS